MHEIAAELNGFSRMELLGALRQNNQASSVQWAKEQLLNAAQYGQGRWRGVEELFGIKYPMFQDAVRLISPQYELSRQEQASIALATLPGVYHSERRIAEAYVRWDLCPATSSFPNPYEPWIRIWAHGGSFTVEHGQFVDFYDSSHMPIGYIMVRCAS